MEVKLVELGVNIDHVATIRQARKGIEPDPLYAAFIAEQNGADQITIHLREDRRHIQFRDLKLLRQTVQTRLNLEMASIEEMIAIAINIKPDTVTLVPEKREEVTTEGGLNLDIPNLANNIKELQENGIEVSLFIEPDIDVLKKAVKLGADAVELHTGAYANANSKKEIEYQLNRLSDSAKSIKSLGVRIVAGHGLNYQNIIPIIKMGLFEEYNIGHSIISRAVFSGLSEAVSTMKRLITQYSSKI